jgi:hypothetical protein
MNTKNNEQNLNCLNVQFIYSVFNLTCSFYFCLFYDMVAQCDRNMSQNKQK